MFISATIFNQFTSAKQLEKSQGNAKPRIAFSDLADFESTYHVAVKSVGSFKKQLSWVERFQWVIIRIQDKDNNQYYALTNKNSLSKRLGIDKNIITTTAKLNGNDVTELVHERLQAMKPPANIIVAPVEKILLPTPEQETPVIKEEVIAVQEISNLDVSLDPILSEPEPQPIETIPEIVVPIPQVEVQEIKIEEKKLFSSSFIKNAISVVATTATSIVTVALKKFQVPMPEKIALRSEFTKPIPAVIQALFSKQCPEKEIIVGQFREPAKWHDIHRLHLVEEKIASCGDLDIYDHPSGSVTFLDRFQGTKIECDAHRYVTANEQLDIPKDVLYFECKNSEMK